MVASRDRAHGPAGDGSACDEVVVGGFSGERAKQMPIAMRAMR